MWFASSIGEAFSIRTNLKLKPLRLISLWTYPLDWGHLYVKLTPQKVDPYRVYNGIYSYSHIDTQPGHPQSLVRTKTHGAMSICEPHVQETPWPDTPSGLDVF